MLDTSCTHQRSVFTDRIHGTRRARGIATLWPGRFSSFELGLDEHVAKTWPRIGGVIEF